MSKKDEQAGVAQELATTKANVEALGQTVDSIVSSVETLDETLAQQDEKIAALQGAAADNSAKLGQILEIIMRSNQADAAEMDEDDPNREGMVELGEAPDGSVAIARTGYKDVDSKEFHQWQRDEAFLNQKVEILFHPTSERNADPVIPCVPHGGRYYPARNVGFLRDRKYIVPRAVVETLLRAKPVHFGNEEYVKGNGERAVRNPTRRGLRYPLILVNPSESDRQWFEKILKQP